MLTEGKKIVSGNTVRPPERRVKKCGNRREKEREEGGWVRLLSTTVILRDAQLSRLYGGGSPT